MTLLLTYLILAISTSFTCSMLEATLLSLTPSYVAQVRDRGVPYAATLTRLKTDVQSPLSAILTLNTVANTAGAAAIGAQAQIVFGNEWLALASGVLTLIILLFAELIPKTIGATYWKELAPVAARVLPIMIFITKPLVLFGNLVTRLVRPADHSQASASKEELTALAKLLAEEGVVAPSESRILTNLFRLQDLRAKDIMTPRTVLFSLPSTLQLSELVLADDADIRKGPYRNVMVFSRIPVFRESTDDIIGFVLRSEVFLHAARGRGEQTLGEIVRPLSMVPESLPVPVLFERLVTSRQHIAIVVDEYGGVDGVVTMEDVIETLLGFEIVDEADRAIDMRETARKRWEERRRRMGLVDEEASGAIA